jgi:hypothetical protein
LTSLLAWIRWSAGESTRRLIWRAFPRPNDRDQTVLGGRGDRACANVLGPGDAFAADEVATQHVPLVALAEGFAGGARFLLDPDRDCTAVAGGGGGDQLLDRARSLSGSDDVADVEGAALAVNIASCGR